MALAPEGDKTLAANSATRAVDPAVSVVVTARGDARMLERCLRSILRCDYDDLEVIVVDNQPPSLDVPRMLVSQFPGEQRLRYVDEPSSSISLARNTGLSRAQADVVAFIDDDVVLDRAWFRSSVETLFSESGIACVTGLSMPGGFDGELQLLLERPAGFDAGFGRKIYRPADRKKSTPLFTYAAAALGAGGCFMMLTQVGREIGGFDPALGPATVACGGEELDLLVRMLRKGYALSYEPRAIAWREQPDSDGSPRRRAYRQGVGLGAMVGKQLITGPRRRRWLRAIPADIRHRRDRVHGEDPDGAEKRPRHLKWIRRLGMIVGPIAYLLSALIVRMRRLMGKQPPSPNPVRVVRRMVVGDETIQVVWFGEAPTPKVRLAWRQNPAEDTASRFEQLVLGSSAAIAPPATSAAGTLRISAVVPARNAEGWIESCLRAIRENDPAEVILVDGGSTDRTVELAQPLVDKVIDDGGAGVAAARMLGVASASQPWIALVDADVVLPPNALRDLDRERCERQLVALQAGLHSVGAGDYWSQSLANHHNHGQSKRWFGVCASIIARDLLLAHPLDAQLRSGEDIDLRLRLTRAGFRIGVSDAMVGLHRFADGFAFAGKQWLADGAGLGRMVRKHGRRALPNAMIPFAAATLGLARGMREALRPWPYFAGFAVGNYIGLWRGLIDRNVPARGRGRKALVASTLVWLLALPALVAAASIALAVSLISLGHAAYEGHLLLVTLAILVVAVPFEVGRGAASGRFSVIARYIAPFTAWAVLLGLIFSGLRLARVVGL
ncbi:MAG: glycosyltransferase [Alphaproteobacteria bacterium]|nr:glycosyltransferase [Alphaproteobacteria bacterium]